MRTRRINVYRDEEGQWRWRWCASNGPIQADSGQGYSDKRDCLRSMEQVTGGIYHRLYSTPTPGGGHYQQGELVRFLPTGGGLERIHVDVTP